MKDFGEHHLCLKKRKKSEFFTKIPCVLRRLTMEDKDEALALHRAMAASATPDIFVPGTDEDFLHILEGGGAVLGVQEGRRIVCMRTVLFQTHDDEILREDMGLLPDQMTRMAFMDYCVVHRDYRGNNLQFLTYYYMEDLLWEDFDYLYTTVSPRNVFSLRNVMDCGFYAFQLKERYGGHMRYLLRKDLKHSPSIRMKRHASAPLRDYPAQQSLMEGGKVGYRLARHISGIWMLFGTLVK
ncbi:MAG: hypothetical protein LBQ42_13335 [Synergistaceae bacterium]|jgi:hypothetical protein|nr:hypothetical protein [Synergistaceae bacterium]